jgi:hypothetical protein
MKKKAVPYLLIMVVNTDCHVCKLFLLLLYGYQACFEYVIESMA